MTDENTNKTAPKPKKARFLPWLIALLVIIGIIGYFRSQPPKDPGYIVRHSNFASKYAAPRDVYVWLPNRYFKPNTAMNVIYMHDGENLFDASKSLSKKSWEAHKTLQKLIDEKKMPQTIIVGISSTNLRGREYLPNGIYKNLPPEYRKEIETGWKGAPLSDEYLRFIVEELKPFIDSKYRTNKGRDNTFIMGSSMGGLISYYAQMEYPEVFGASASLSMHYLLGAPLGKMPDEKLFAPVIAKAFEDYTKSKNPKPNYSRIYIDNGDNTLDKFYPPYADLIMPKLRAIFGENPKYFEYKFFGGTDHSEGSWAQRLDVPMLFVTGPYTPPEPKR